MAVGPILTGGLLYTPSMILTLGLYWPFAAINMARMRLQAVKVITARDPKELVSAQTLHQGDAAGDAAADLLGVDIGL